MYLKLLCKVIDFRNKYLVVVIICKDFLSLVI